MRLKAKSSSQGLFLLEVERNQKTKGLIVTRVDDGLVLLEVPNGGFVGTTMTQELEKLGVTLVGNVVKLVQEAELKALGEEVDTGDKFI